ncbi:MAG: transglycosylase SLT domain-containing protein [Deltaproteobacteria bacterium]|nr:transglycosylase SLT domain-containing protein [Deltaproteobacteria bacterium]
MERSFCSLAHRFKSHCHREEPKGRRGDPGKIGIVSLALAMTILITPFFAHADPLPKILEAEQMSPANLEDIETLIDFSWFEKAWKALQSYSQEEDRVMFLEARALMGLKKYEEANDLFQKIIEKTEDPEMREESLLKVASGLSRLKRYPESIKIYEELMHSATSKKVAQKMAKRAFKTALEAKDYEKSLRLLAHFSGPETAWWRGWCDFRLGHLEKALRSWHKISSPQSLYWRSVVLEKLNRHDAAEKLRQKLVDQYATTYYGFLVLKNFPSLNSPAPLEEGKERWKWEEKYPRSYKTFVERESKKRKLDPYLVFAVIWQESRFRENAVSSSGAIGLMQMMPQTALVVAESSGLKHFHLPEILKPDVNIRLGAFYLHFLQKLFKNETAYSVAAYNAGEEAVARWLSLRQDESPEMFVEEIPFDETRDYVRRVLTAQSIYHWLYL